MMLKKHGRAPLRCINCGIRMYHGARPGVAFDKLSPRTRLTLQQWISSDIIQSVLCYECDTLLRTLDSGGEGKGEGPPERLVGHSRVCRECGCSVLNKRHFSLERDNPHLRRVMATLPKIYEHLKMVCLACYTRADRALKKMTANDDTDWCCSTTEKKRETSHLTLSNYWRVRGVRASCAVAGCRQGDTPRAPLLVRRRLLLSRRLYLPGAARLCAAHCRPDADLTCLLQRKPSNDFTSEQIADMLFLIKTFPPPLDADNVEAMDQSLRRIWLGVTLEDFLAKKRDNQSISPRALAIRLCSQTSGECPEVLASLFQLPREDVDDALRATAHLEHKNDPATPPLHDSIKSDEKASMAEAELNESCLKDDEIDEKLPQDMDIGTLFDQIMSK